MEDQLMANTPHDEAVLEAHARWSRWLAMRDAHDARREEINRELEAADAELRALARRRPG